MIPHFPLKWRPYPRWFIGIVILGIVASGALIAGMLGINSASAILANVNQAGRFVYAVDALPDRLENRILVMDSQSGSLVREIATGYLPIISFTPNGRLFLLDTRAKTQPWERMLAELDPTSGRILHETRVPGDYWDYILAPKTPVMVPSRDNRWLFVSMVETKGPGVDEYWIQLFDTQHFIFRPEHLLVGNHCSPQLMPSTDNKWLYVGCWGTSTIYRFDLSTYQEAGQHVIAGGTQDATRIAITPGTPAGFALRPNGKQLYVVTHDAQLIEVDTTIMAATRTIPIDVPSDRYVPDFRLLTSPDGKRLFLGVGKTGDPMEERNLADEVWVLDTASGKAIQRWQAGMYFFYGWQLSRNGRTSYFSSLLGNPPMGSLDLETGRTRAYDKPVKLIVSVTTSP